MPSVSKKQHGFMGKVAGDSAFAKKAGVPQSVGQDFMQADAGAGGMGGMKRGGKVSSASKRADGIAQRGKTRGTMVMCGGGYMKGKK